MAHPLNAEALQVEVLGPHGAAEDLFDVQDLWPITTDLTDAATRATNAIHDIALALAQDTEAPPALRQQLLEIRARLVYAYFDISSNIISVTTALISRAAFAAAAANVEPANSGTARFQRLFAAILSGCASSRRVLDDALDAWGSFAESLSQFFAARSRSTQSGVVAFLRNFGTFASSAPAPSPAQTETPQETSSGVGVREDLSTMLQSLERIEAFWKKRQALFCEPRRFGREELIRLRSIHQLGEEYLYFTDPLTQGQQDLARPQPALARMPYALDESEK